MNNENINRNGLNEVEGDEYQNMPDSIKKRLDLAADFDFALIGYKSDELLRNLQLRSTYEDLVRSGGDLEGFQRVLEERGVIFVRGSSELLKKKRDPFGFQKYIGEAGTRVNAGFISKEVIAQELLDVTHTQAVREELLRLSSAPVGAILMDETPNPKSIYHEGGHALQQILGFDMNTKDKKERILREIEINSSLIGLRRKGLLREVSCNKLIPKMKADGSRLIGPFGPVSQISPNDILAEEEYFTSNLVKLQQ